MDGFKNTTKTSYDTASGRKFANGGMTVSRNDMAGGQGPMSKPAMVAKYAKGGHVKKAEQKIGRVMTEFTEGKLHSGSKEGPKVKSTKQAVAIALNEARAAGAKIPRAQKARGGSMDRSMLESTSARPVKVGLTPAEKAGGAAIARGNRIAREEAGEEKIMRMAAPKDDFRARHGIEVEKTTIKRIPADAVDRERAARAARAAKPTRGPAGQSYTGVPLIDNAVNAVRRATGLKKGGLAVMPKGKGC